MIRLCLLLLLLLIVAGLVVLGGLREDPRWRLRKALSSADQQLSAAAQTARRQMNDAAGQSWRNLVE